MGFSLVVYACVHFFVSIVSSAVMPFPMRVCLLLLCLVVASAPPHLTASDRGAAEPSPDSTDSLASLRAGIAHVEAGRAIPAIQTLNPLMQRQPDLADDERGTVGFWLGRAHVVRGDTATARRVWYTAVTEATRRGHTAVDAADALLTSYTPSQFVDAASVLVPAYTHVVHSLGQPVSQPEAALRTGYAARLALVLPSPLDERVHCGTPPCARPTGTESETVLRWWRSRDPLPSTEVNERLVTHLQREARARQDYAWDRRASGLDDRGEVWIRFGPPEDVRYLTYQPVDGAYRFQKLLTSVGVTRSEVPPRNEIWQYPRIDPSVYYLFTPHRSAGRPFLETDIYDLLPSKLQTTSVGQSQRSQTIMRAAMQILEMYYEQMLDLGTIGQRYNDLINYRRTRDRSPITLFMQRHYQRGRELDRQSAQYRASVMPTQWVPVVDEQRELPLAVRPARFLEADGTTRVELYWSVPVASLAPAPEWQARFLQENGEPLTGRYRLRTALTAYDRGYRASTRVTDTVTVAPKDVRAGGWLPSQRLTASGLEGPFHVAGRWNHYATPRRDDGLDDGTLVTFTQRRTDSLQALSSDPQRLEVSDVLPASVASAEALIDLDADALREQVVAHDRVDASRPLALTFEVYHLTYDGDDRTRYTVAYETSRSQRRSGVRGWFGATEEENTETATTYRGTARTERQVVVLELPSWEVSRPTPVEVTVRVTDDVTGQTVARTLSFTAVPADEV